MRSTLAPRALVVTSVAAYVVVFNWSYVALVGSRYDYWGFSLDGPPLWHFVVCCAFSIIPAFWMPLGLRRPSQFLFLVQYFVLFIPATFVVYYASEPRLTLDEAFLLNLTMFGGLSLVEATYLLPIVRLRALELSPTTVSLGLASLFILLVSYVAWTFHSVFRIVNLADVYEIRDAMVDVAAQSGTRMGLYAQAWLAGFFLPLMFSLGMFTRRRWLALAILPGYAFLFGVAGNKTALGALVVLPVLYFWSTLADKNASAAVAMGLSGLLLLGAIAGALGMESMATWSVALVNFRSFAIPQLLIVQYFKFFADHPVTLLSHVTGFNLVLSYPYDTDVGHVVSEHYYSSPIQANAGMWAGDGLAGFGLAGILLISVVCAAVFWIIDSVASECDVRFVTVALGAIAMNFANTSLFTTIVSGGLGLLLIALVLMPERGRFQLVKGRYVPRRLRPA